MGKLISADLNLNKIREAKALIRKANNGVDYFDITISINDEPDDRGNNCAIWIKQTKEEVTAKATKVYLGNGKVFWSSDANVTATAKPAPAANTSNDDPFA